jgi:hypothetical protein
MVVGTLLTSILGMNRLVTSATLLQSSPGERVAPRRMALAAAARQPQGPRGKGRIANWHPQTAHGATRGVAAPPREAHQRCPPAISVAVDVGVRVPTHGLPTGILVIITYCLNEMRDGVGVADVVLWSVSAATSTASRGGSWGDGVGVADGLLVPISATTSTPSSRSWSKGA